MQETYCKKGIIMGMFSEPIDNNFKAVVEGFEYYYNIDGNGWPDEIVISNGGDVFAGEYCTRNYVLKDEKNRSNQNG